MEGTDHIATWQDSGSPDWSIIGTKLWPRPAGGKQTQQLNDDDDYLTSIPDLMV